MPEARGADYVVRHAPAHADALYNFARYVTRNPSEAEDLVQETYARALGAAHRFEAGTDLKAWLFRILRNVHVDRVRRSRHEGASPPPEGDDAPGAVEADPGLDPEQVRSLAAQDVANAVEGLPAPLREVILLDVEGFTEREVADVLVCAPGTVKSRLSRARAALRRVLRSYAPGGKR